MAYIEGGLSDDIVLVERDANPPPEEDSHRAPKRLISHADRQWEITGTINSTNTSPGKGWMSPDRGKITPFDSRLEHRA